MGSTLLKNRSKSENTVNVGKIVQYRFYRSILGQNIKQFSKADTSKCLFSYTLSISLIDENDAKKPTFSTKGHHLHDRVASPVAIHRLIPSLMTHVNEMQSYTKVQFIP